MGWGVGRVRGRGGRGVRGIVSCWSGGGVVWVKVWAMIGWLSVIVIVIVIAVVVVELIPRLIIAPTAPY